MHIGITIGIQKKNESIWINGIKMNAIFLAKALKLTGNKVTIIDTSNKIGVPKQEDLDFDIKEFPTKRLNDEHPNIDILIMLGTSLPEKWLRDWKALDPRRRVIKYQCGNNYVIDMERSIFATEEQRKDKSFICEYQRGVLDGIWYVPQQGHQNRSYYAALMDLPIENVIPVPFVWDPMFLDRDVETWHERIKSGEAKVEETGVPVYVPNRNIDTFRYFIMEPNQNVVKFCSIPILIIELLKRTGQKIGMANIISGARLIKNGFFQSWLTKLDLAKPGDTNLRTHCRMAVIPALAKYADVVVSHQWHNPLNYAYLDTLYLQYPLIHNAEMIKDAGYYYPGFDAHTGMQELKYAIENHDGNLEAYNENTERVLERYTVYNEGMIEIYTKLLNGLKTKTIDSSLSYEYDWKTNLYKN